MADTSLIFSIIARDKTGTAFMKIQAQAASTGRLVAMALGPAVAPIAAVGAGAVLGLGAAMASAGAAAGVFGGVMAASVTQINENATKFQDLADKVELYGREADLMKAAGEDNASALKKQATAALELKARLSLLPPAERAATEGYMQMKSDWQDFVDANKPATFATLTNGYRLLGQVVLKLQPFFDIGRAAVDRLLAAVQRLVDNGGIESLAANAGPAMASLTSIVINVSTVIGRLFGKFAGQGPGILDWIEDATTKWVAWSSSDPNSGLSKFFDYVTANGPRVLQVVTDLAKAAVHIAQAVSPLAPISLAIAGGLARFIAAVPPGVITAIVAGFVAFNVALKLFAIYQGIATVVQWAYNAALLASPMTWIVLAIIALVAVIVLVATKTRFFQTIWNAVWGFMKAVGAWFAGPFAAFFVRMWNKIKASLVTAKNQFLSVVNFVKNLFLGWVRVNQQVAQKLINGFNRVVAFFRAAPGRIRSALSGMFNGLWTGFKSVVNKIVSGWNNLSFGIPGFSFAGISVPGFSIGTPNLPYLAQGAGMVRQSGLAFIHRGESVTPAARVTPYRSTSGRDGGTIVIKGDGSRVANLILELLREAIRDKGGDPVKVLRST